MTKHVNCHETHLQRLHHKVQETFFYYYYYFFFILIFIIIIIIIINDSIYPAVSKASRTGVRCC